jgi:hypothetical protein
MSDINIFSLLPSYIQAFALIAAGVWAYRKFIYQRANEPATDIDIDLKFVGIQDDKWIIEITSFLKNQSLVRHEYKDFQVSIRYLLPEDKVEDGDLKILYQLKFSRSIDERINGGKRFFGNVEYINPRQEFRHRYITHIPINATFVWVQCRFLFKIRKETKMNSQRIFRVPSKEEGRSNKQTE